MSIRPIRPLLAVAATVSCLALAACSSSSSTSSAPPASTTSAAPSTSAPAPSASASDTASATASSAADSNIPAGLTGDAKTIATNWVTFFDGTAPAATRLPLLQNGSKFSAVLTGQAASTQGKETSAQVTAVTVNGSSADVTWNLLLAGTPVLKAQKGQAVLTNGTWQVADSSFCGLLSMQPPVPAACKA